MAARRHTNGMRSLGTVSMRNHVCLCVLCFSCPYLVVASVVAVGLWRHLLGLYLGRRLLRRTLPTHPTV